MKPAVRFGRGDQYIRRGRGTGRYSLNASVIGYYVLTGRGRCFRGRVLHPQDLLICLSRR